MASVEPLLALASTSSPAVKSLGNIHFLLQDVVGGWYEDEWNDLFEAGMRPVKQFCGVVVCPETCAQEALTDRRSNE